MADDSGSAAKLCVVISKYLCGKFNIYFYVCVHAY